jgi:cytochrome c biogenesis protein CcmG/thiol:disulfide interchange protein DsbE
MTTQIAFGRLLALRILALIILGSCLLPRVAAAEPAPAFTLRDAAGNEVSLADFEGQPLMLHFWATWCPYCKKLQPGLERTSRDYKDADLVLLGISFREDDGAQPQAVLERRGLSFKTLVEGESVAGKYKVRGTPTTFFIDRQGEIVAVTNTSNPDDPILKKHADAIAR